MPAAKGSARTPLGPKMSREKCKSIVEKNIQIEGLSYLSGLAAPHSKSDYIISERLEKKDYFTEDKNDTL